MAQIYMLGLIALVAAIFKGLILYRAVSQTKLQAAFVILSLVLILQNSLEFLTSLFLASDPATATPYVHAVIASLYILVLSIVHISVVITQKKYGGEELFLFFSAWVLLLGLFHANGILIDSFQLTSFSIISVPGPTYPLLLLYAASAMACVLYLMVRGLRSKDREIQVKSWVALKALSAIIVVILGVVVLRVLGFNSSTAVALPIASTIFLWVLLLDRSDEFLSFEHSWRDQMAIFFIKWKTLFILARKKNINPIEWSDAAEKSIVMGAMKRTSVKQEAADLLEIKRTTFNRKLDKYKEPEEIAEHQVVPVTVRS